VLLSLLYFALMIGVLIFVHELGHFLAARWMGVHPKQFAIGVGPKIASFERDGTEFRVGILPLGGYVMMAETPEEAGEGRVALRAASLGRRALIAVAGPVFSFVFPMVCYLLVGLGSSSLPVPVVDEVADDSPAATAGLRPGDEIVAVEGQRIRMMREIAPLVAESDGAVTLEVIRDGESLEHTIVPITQDGARRIGLKLETGDARPFPLAERLPWTLEYAATEPFSVAGQVLSVLGGFVTGESSTTELGGPIMIFQVSGKAGNQGWRAFLIVMAIISVNLALINMLPIPILDGGRLALIGVEAIQRRPLSARTQQITAMVGMVMVIGLMVLAFKNDIERYWDAFM